MNPSLTASKPSDVFITGIGSRETPEPILQLLEEIGYWVATKGYVGRSGRAPGADKAFERGYLRAGDSARFEAFLPWAKFEPDGRGNPDWYIDSQRLDTHGQALEIAESVIPWWGNLSAGARSLHGRNPFQVLGTNLDLPSNAVVYYAGVDKQGLPRGGTRTAIVIAQQHGIPTFNLFLPFIRTIFETLVTV